MKDCPIDQVPCEHFLCLNGCAKQRMDNRCQIRRCLSEAQFTPRLVYYPATGWEDAKGCPVDLVLKVCQPCAQTLTLKQIESEGLRRLATNLLGADGRSAPDYNRTRLFFLPLGVVKAPEHEGMIEEPKEKTRIIRWD